MTNTLWQNITPADATAMIKGQEKRLEQIPIDRVSDLQEAITAGRTIWGGLPIQIINGEVVTNLDILSTIAFCGPEQKYIYCLVETDLTDQPVPDGSLFDQIAESAEQAIRLATGEQLDNFDKNIINLMCSAGPQLLNHPYLIGAVLGDGMYDQSGIITEFITPQHPELIAKFKTDDRAELPPAERHALAEQLLISFSYCRGKK